jgi:AcrR family transcriptional regulator
MRPVLTAEEVAKSRADVCRVAEVLFARHGVEGVTMRQIAAELGWSSTTAYRYFKNKEEILAAVRAAAFDRFCEVIEEATRSSPDSRKCARNVGEAYLGFALSNQDAYRMMFDVSQAAITGSAELTQALERARRSMVSYVAPLIEQASCAAMRMPSDRCCGHRRTVWSCCGFRASWPTTQNCGNSTKEPCRRWCAARSPRRLPAAAPAPRR